MKTLKYLSCVAAASLTLAGCGGGGGSSVTPTANGTSKNAQMSMKLTFNTSPSNPAVRHRNYVSQNTKGLGVFVKATGTGTFPSTTTDMRTPTWATAIAPGFTGQGATCTAVIGSSYSCTIVLTAPVGYDDFQITTWDGAPTGQGVGASFASTVNNLSFQNITDQLVIVNQTNAFNFSLDGVVKTVVLNLSPNSLIDGAASGSATNPLTPQLQVRGIDADGNTIIGSDPWVDSNGAPVAVNVALTANPDTSPSPSPAGPAGTGHLNDAATPAVNDSCAALSANGGVQNPSQGSCVLTYDGGDLDSISLTATTNSGLVGAAQITNAQLALTRTANGGFGVPGPPSIAEYSTGLASGTNPYYAALGPDSNVWFADSGTQSVGKITPSGTITTYAVPNSPGEIAAGPDEDMWFTEPSTGSVGRINPDGSGFVDMSVSNVPPFGITVGPDNTMWVTQNLVSSGLTGLGNIGWDSSGAPVVLSSAPLVFNASSYLTGITSGPNNHLWVLDGGMNQVYEVSTASTIVNTYPLPANSIPFDIKAGPDGNLWITLSNASAVVRMTPAGVTTTYSLSAGTPNELTVGPDGNIWVATSAPDAIVRIDTTTGSLQSYSAGVTAGASLTGIATGSDHNLWFTENAGNRIGKLTP